ncbi:restin homolog [Eurytemora carolleeae]|uniref:restin homolog n=1 Tax=Eurytemora carolleeae TaxID=1294199 RepID=UPI000C75985C|nr:restin homolog [Eurytemora carolleeae]|eukprot:XP_023346033.1 restin homolog [Eurytemora affinis]
MLSLCLIIQFRLRGTPLGFCLRVIVNEKPLNLENTTSSVVSVIYYKSMHTGFKFQIYYDVMPSIFSRLCGKKNNDNSSPPGPTGLKMDSSHVRFQDSDLDDIGTFSGNETQAEIHSYKSRRDQDQNRDTEQNVYLDTDRYLENGGFPEKNGYIEQIEIQDGEEEDNDENMYSKVFEPPPPPQPFSEPDSEPTSKLRPKPRPRSRSRSRDPLSETVSSVNPNQEKQRRRFQPRSRKVRRRFEGFDWLESKDESPGEVSVLKNMVYKLTQHLSKEQSRHLDTGISLTEFPDAPWIHELGGLVPLLVAYEEEIRELQDSKQGLQEEVEVGRSRLQELIKDNIEMAGQLQDIATSAPVDLEEHKLIKESAMLVLEENILLKERISEISNLLSLKEEEHTENIRRVAEEKRDMIKNLEEQVSGLRNEINGLKTKNQELQEQVRSGEEIRLRRAENLETSARDDLTAERVRRDKQRAEIEELQEEIKRIKTTFSQGRVLVYYCSRMKG